MLLASSAVVILKIWGAWLWLVKWLIKSFIFVSFLELQIFLYFCLEKAWCQNVISQINPIGKRSHASVFSREDGSFLSTFQVFSLITNYCKCNIATQDAGPWIQPDYTDSPFQIEKIEKCEDGCIRTIDNRCDDWKSWEVERRHWCLTLSWFR